jgi:LPXTG-site transpeptidase (sortase) family protein
VPASGSTTTSAQPRTTAKGSATPAPPSVVLEASEGKQAKSNRVRFEPQSMSLPGGGRASVQPAATVDGELKVPERVRHVGWWDGSAYAGDPFGTTVIAGHVDSATDGVGFFARLLKVRAGDKVTLRGDGHRAVYRIVSVKVVARGALSSDTRAFDQTGDHRLVLITCTGSYDRTRGGYSSNLLVTGVPVGLAR